MKDFHLRFYDNRWFDGMIDLLENDSSIITESSGAYVIGTSDGTMLTYPWGSSPVFYIGKADNLKIRLLDHKKYINGAIEDHEEINWWPRYQYGAAYGASCVWYSCYGKQQPLNLEADLIQNFYDRYGSIPIANGAWPKGIKKPKSGKRDD